jgi:hypothetical protein
MIGQTISHFRILSQLGDCSMSVLYEAEDLKLQRHVVLKFLPQKWRMILLHGNVRQTLKMISLPAISWGLL